MDSETSVYTADPETPGRVVVVNVECMRKNGTRALSDATRRVRTRSREPAEAHSRRAPRGDNIGRSFFALFHSRTHILCLLQKWGASHRATARHLH